MCVHCVVILLKKVMEVLARRALEIRAPMHEWITRCQDLSGCMMPRVSAQALLITFVCLIWQGKDSM